MTIEIDFSYLVDGYFDSINYYRSETPMNLSDMPPPTQTGIQGLSFTDTTAVDGTDYYIRFSSVKNSFEKISDEIKILKSDPYWNNVISLMHFDGNILDLKGSVWSAYNNGYSYIDSISGFGSKLFKEYGSNSYIQVSDSYLGDFNHDDFTIEFILTTPNNSNSNFCWVLSTDYLSLSGSRGWQIVFNPLSSKLSFASSIKSDSGSSLDYSFIESNVLNKNTDYNIAITRSGDVFSLFINGFIHSQQEKHATMNSGNKIFSGMSISSPSNTTNSFSIDELRITRGIARYTENYEVDNRPYINY